MKMFRKDEGFTLVELMVVVLIIGILVAIAVPVFLNASANAEAKSCQANQRTIIGAISTYGATTGTPLVVVAAGEVLVTGGAANINGSLVPAYIKTAPKCPKYAGGYFVTQALNVTGDAGAAGFTTIEHKLP